MTAGKRLGDILIQQNLVTQEVVAQALHAQNAGTQRLGQILVRMKVISADQLADTLASQLELTICDISNNFSPEVKKLIPRYLCKKYGVLPLSLKSYNILELAMANPSDNEARMELENVTGKVIEPRLAKLSDIEQAIPQYIRVSLSDLFSPIMTRWFTRLGLVTCVLLIFLLGAFIKDYINNENHGTVTTTEEFKEYKNRDLTLKFYKNGQIKFNGRGAFAQGHYTVSFASDKELSSFVSNKRKELSDSQLKWLIWVSENEQLDISFTFKSNV